MSGWRQVQIASGGWIAVVLRTRNQPEMPLADRRLIEGLVATIEAYEAVQRSRVKRTAEHESALARWADDGGRV